MAQIKKLHNILAGQGQKTTLLDICTYIWDNINIMFRGVQYKDMG
jgi:hypothetical protein